MKQCYDEIHRKKITRLEDVYITFIDHPLIKSAIAYQKRKKNESLIGRQFNFKDVSASLQLTAKEQQYQGIRRSKYSTSAPTIEIFQQIQKQTTHQKTQQKKKQITTNTQAQYQQMMNRIKNQEKNLESNLDNLGINKAVLKRKDIPSELHHIWDNLTGKNAKEIKKKYGNIAFTRVTTDAWEVIKAHANHFQMGVEFKHLPSGFRMVKKKNKLALDYNEEEVKNQEALSPFAPRLNIKYPSLPDMSSDAFFKSDPTSKLTIEEQKKEFDKKDKLKIEKLATLKKINKKDSLRRTFEQVLSIDTNLELNKILNENLKQVWNELSFDELKKLRMIFFYSGSKGVQFFLLKLSTLKIKNQLEPFKNTFLKHSENYIEFLNQKNSDAIDFICKLTLAEKNWWETLTRSHLEYNQNANLSDLAESFSHFLKEFKKTDKDISLPMYCKIKPRHMKIVKV